VNRIWTGRSTARHQRANEGDIAVRDTIGTALYFTTYESAKQFIANVRGNEPTSPSAVIVAGGLCGLVSWACVSPYPRLSSGRDVLLMLHALRQIYPIDSAKSIYQRNILTAGSGHTKSPPKIQFFNRRMYRGKYTFPHATTRASCRARQGREKR